MKAVNLTALKAVYDTDPCRTRSDRANLLRTLGLTDDGSEPQAGDRIVSFAEASERLACTRRTLHNIVKRGGLNKVKLPGATKARGFLASDIDALLKNSVSIRTVTESGVTCV